MIRKATAVWRGTGRAGTGNLSTDSGVLAQTPYSFKTRFENEKGTNPEELIAAAHAGCFTGARVPASGRRLHADRAYDRGRGHARAGRPGISHQPFGTDAAGSGYEPGRSWFVRMAGDAEKNCPVSKVLKAEITLDAKLI